VSTDSVRLPPDVAAEIRKPIEGQGGFQDLLRKLQGQLSADGSVLTVTDEDIERIGRYKKYEPGGFEERLAPLLELLRQQGLIR
jgi:hypothetical protein